MRCGVVRCDINGTATTVVLQATGDWEVEPPLPADLRPAFARALGLIVAGLPSGPSAGFFGPPQLAAVADWIGGTVELDPAYRRAMADVGPGIAH